jgi:hypothetical protein
LLLRQRKALHHVLKRAMFPVGTCLSPGVPFRLKKSFCVTSLTYKGSCSAWCCVNTPTFRLWCRRISPRVGRTASPPPSYSPPTNSLSRLKFGKDVDEHPKMHALRGNTYVLFPAPFLPRTVTRVPSVRLKLTSATCHSSDVSQILHANWWVMQKRAYPAEWAPLGPRTCNPRP